MLHISWFWSSRASSALLFGPFTHSNACLLRLAEISSLKSCPSFAEKLQLKEFSVVAYKNWTASSHLKKQERYWRLSSVEKMISLSFWLYEEFRLLYVGNTYSRGNTCLRPLHFRASLQRCRTHPWFMLLLRQQRPSRRLLTSTFTPLSHV